MGAIVGDPCPMRNAFALRLPVVLLAAAVLFGAAPACGRARLHEGRASGPTAEGPWLQQGWDWEDWSRAPVRGWGYSAPWDAVAGYPSTTEQYPWGYTTPFVRVGRQCVSSEVNLSPGGETVRYQRVRPSHYCR